MKTSARRLIFWLAVPFFGPASFCLASTMFAVTLDTSPLIGHPAGPFSLNFQFTDGQGTGDANNTVTLSSFAFGGGSAAGGPSLTGGASGSLGSGVVLTDSAFFNAFTEGFTPGT